MLSTGRRSPSSTTMAGLARIGLAAHAFIYVIIGLLVTRSPRGAAMKKPINGVRWPRSLNTPTAISCFGSSVSASPLMHYGG